jgi:hypothetical protein
MRIAMAALALGLLISGCGGHSPVCTKAVSCGSAIANVGPATAEEAVRTCERVGEFADTCCSIVTSGYKAGAGTSAPAACN